MAKWQLTQHGWPIGQWLIPVGTVLDSADWTWNGAALPWPPPVNAMALDQEAYDEMIKHYQYWQVLSCEPVQRHGDP